MRKLGINWGKSNICGSVTKQCYVTHLYHEQFRLVENCFPVRNKQAIRRLFGNNSLPAELSFNSCRTIVQHM